MKTRSQSPSTVPHPTFIRPINCAISTTLTSTPRVSNTNQFMFALLRRPACELIMHLPLQGTQKNRRKALLHCSNSFSGEQEQSELDTANEVRV